MAEKAKSSPKGTVNVIIGVVLMLGISLIPPVEPITQYGMQVLGVFIGMLYLWITTDTLWPSVLGIVAMMLIGHEKAATIIQSALGTDTVWFIVMISVLLIPMTTEHVTEYIAKFFLTLKITKGRPWVFTFFFVYATFVVAMVANAVPAIMLMWAILYSILEVSDIKPGDKYGAYMIFSVVYGAALGTSAFPFKGALMTILKAYESVSEVPIDRVRFWGMAVILCTILVFLFVFLGKFVFRLDTSKLKNVDAKQYFIDKGLIKMSLRQKALLGMLGLNTLLLLWPSVMPSTWFVTTLINRLASFGIAALVLVIMMVVKVEGKSLIDFQKAAAKISWSTVFMVAAALYVAGQLSNADAGIVAFIEGQVAPIFAGSNEFVLILMFLLVGFVVTNFANNAAMGVMLMPVLYAVTRSGNFHVPVIAALLAMVLFQAFLTPSASVHASLLHGNKTWIQNKEIYRYGFLVSICSVFVLLLIGGPLGILFLG